MKYSSDEILELSEMVKSRLSEKRYKHTLSVLEAAQNIAKYFVDIDISELSAAALLHDVTKELSYEEQLLLLKDGGIVISDDDRNTAPILHSLSAQVVIKRDFAKFATDSIISAVEKHTTGSADMSLFDKIIFIADYVEDTRIYDSCVKVREQLFSALSMEVDRCKNENEVNKAVFDSLVFTENDLIKRGRIPNQRSLIAKKSISKHLLNS